MNSTLYADIFPINIESIPPLFAYSVKSIDDNKLLSVGGKLANRLKNKFGGGWIWCNKLLISDQQISEDLIQAYLKELWPKEDIFEGIQIIQAVHPWTPTAWEQSDFVARSLMTKFQAAMRTILAAKKQEFGKIRVNRKYNMRGWVVAGKPALSLTISSKIVHMQNLAEYAASLKDPQELIGMVVDVILKDFKGEIVEVTGNLAEQREWLLGKSTDEATRDLIKRAPDSELTVKIKTRTSKYIYIASMLRPIIRMGDLVRFGVNSREVVKSLRLSPQVQYHLVSELAKIGQSHQIILDRFDSKKFPKIFLTAEDVNFSPELMVGKGKINLANQRIYQSLQNYGLFKRLPLFSDNLRPIKVGIINAIPKISQDTSDPQLNRNKLRDFLTNLKDSIEKLGFALESVIIEGKREQIIKEITRVNLEKAINLIEPHKPDILLVLFPGHPKKEEANDADDDNMYHALKSCTISRGIPSQVIYEKTFDEQYAMDNIVLGILAKIGNIPFILAKPLPYADIVVGIDIARRIKQNSAGSINATAITRVYFSSGEFLRYVIHDAPLEGETIPPRVLRTLFPLKEFEGKRVIIQRDGLFRGQEKAALKAWAAQIKAKFILIEVIKSGAPRLYQQNQTIDKPPKGTALKLSSTEALLVSSPPPFKGSTPRPLHIRTDDDFSIEEALHSVLSLTLLHYGSVREPRLPVTIHYSDKIAELALLGIKPKDLEGTFPFWL